MTHQAPCGECHLKPGEVCDICGRYHEIKRPTGNNADEWHVFLTEYPNALPFYAVQIAEAIDDAERNALERAIARMGWPEIHAFRSEIAKGQGVCEDAGGYLMRAYRRLFGLPEADLEIVTHQQAARAMVAAANGEVAPAAPDTDYDPSRDM
jgi:hypothetical protein